MLFEEFSRCGPGPGPSITDSWVSDYGEVSVCFTFQDIDSLTMHLILGTTICQLSYCGL